MNEWQEHSEYLLDRQGYLLFNDIWVEVDFDDLDDGEEMWPLSEPNCS